MGLKLLRFSWLLFLGVLAACGGGGGGGGSSNSGGNSSSSSSGAVVPPNAFIGATITAGENPNQLTFSWTFNGTAAAFRLEGDPDGASSFSPLDISGDDSIDADTIGSADVVDGDIDELNLSIRLLSTDLINAQYRVVALGNNGEVLDRSEELSIMEVAGEDLVGYFKATNSQQDDAFGYSVAISSMGDIMAAGAPSESSNADGISSDGTGEGNNDASGAGAVYVFRRDEQGAWSREAYIKASNSEAGDGFGASLALSADGNILIVGAPSEDSNHAGVSTDGTGEGNNSLSGAGAVYAFKRDENGNWTQEAYIKPAHPGDVDYFGNSVSIGHLLDDYFLVVGAPNEDSDYQGVSTNGDGETDNGAFVAGAAYVFKRVDTGQWSQHAYIKASNAEAGDKFGWSVAMAGNATSLAVGTVQEESNATGINGNQADNSLMSAGAAYVFRLAGGDSWTQEAYVKASNTNSNNYFGWSLALSYMGDTLAVSARSEDSSATGVSTNGDGESDNSAPGAGAVYLYTRNSMNVWSQQAYIKASNTQEDQDFGYSVALSGAGDRLAVGAPREDNNALGVAAGSPTGNSGAFYSGAAYVFQLDSGNWTQHAYIKASNTETSDRFGSSVSLTRSGRALAVGASEEDSDTTVINGNQSNNNADGAGAVYLY